VVADNDDVKPDDSGFDAVVEYGRAIRQRREANEVHERLKLDDKRARDNQYERLQLTWYSCSIAGVFTCPMGWYYLMLFCLFAVGPASAIVMYLVAPSLIYLFLPALAVGAIVVYVWSRTAVRRGLERERSWISALPFRLTGYEECLGDLPTHNSRRLALAFDFEAGVPTREVLLDLLSGDGGSWKIDHGVATRDPGVNQGYRNHEHNRALRAWFHRLVDQQLRPLHEAYRVRAIQIDNGR
jgi:hypothetical protein